MVGRGDDDDVAGQPVDLEQEGADYTLDLTGLVSVATLLGDRVELVEEQHAGPQPHSVKQRLQSGGRLAEEAADKAFIADG